jgi:hypothetical protein
MCFIYSSFQWICNPDIIKCRCRRCAISNFTEFNDAELPDICRMILGWILSNPSMRSSTILPPTICKNGRTPSKTISICSGTNGGPSGKDCMTSCISGIRSFNPRSNLYFVFSYKKCKTYIGKKIRRRSIRCQSNVIMVH